LRLLCIVPGAIGDFILILPAIAWLRSHLRPVWLELWVSRVNLQLAQRLSYVDWAVALTDTGIDKYPIAENCLNRMKTFERIISWWGTGNSDFVDRIKRAHNLIDFLPALPENSTKHVTEFRRIQLEGLFGLLRGFIPAPKIDWTQEEERFAHEFLADKPKLSRLVIHPGASGQSKRWSFKKFADLADRLASNSKTHLILLEGPLDEVTVNKVAAAVRNSTLLDKIKIENLSRLAAVLNRCDVYVGNDSGITHLAAAVGIFTVAIFLNSNPQVWAPRGPQVCFLRRPRVDEVLSSIHY